MMRRFMPPSLRSFDPPPVLPETNDRDPVRDAIFHEGYVAGQHAGFTAGVAEAEEKARIELERQAALMRAELDERLAHDAAAIAFEKLLAQRAADLRGLEHEVREAIAAALTLLFPTMFEHAAGQELIALIGDALTARTPEHITVKASPETITAITALPLPDAAADRLTLTPDPTLGFGVAEIAWAGGGLTFDPAALLTSVAAAIAPAPPSAELTLSDSLRKDETYA